MIIIIKFQRWWTFLLRSTADREGERQESLHGGEREGERQESLHGGEGER